MARDALAVKEARLMNELTKTLGLNEKELPSHWDREWTAVARLEVIVSAVKDTIQNLTDELDEAKNDRRVLRGQVTKYRKRLGVDVEEPQAEEPQAEEPQAEEPQAEEPQAEEPQAEEPQAEED